MSNFVPRLTRPEAGNKYYITTSAGGWSRAIKGSPTDSKCNVLSNCVGYAFGRFHEIANRQQMDFFDPVNAENIFNNAIQHGLKTGSTPKLGSAIVWQKGATLSNSDGAGHIAIVEQINSDGSIVTSESGWGCYNPWWLTTRRKGNNGNWGAGSQYKFLGFIHQPEEQEENNNGDDSMQKKGIDISYCQTRVDWNNVDAEFVIMRAGYGREAYQKDSMFESHYAGAKSKGIPCGVYWYSYAKDEDGARAEARACLEVIKGKQFEYPIFYDVEENSQFALGRSKVSAIMRAFLETVEAAGYWVGLYGSYSSLLNYTEDDIRTRYSIWLAHWDVQKSPYPYPYGVWQYKVSKASGVSGDCDLDYCYVDYESEIKARGLNGFAPSTPAEPQLTEQEKYIKKLEEENTALKKDIDKYKTLDYNKDGKLTNEDARMILEYYTEFLAGNVSGSVEDYAEFVKKYSK